MAILERAVQSFELHSGGVEFWTPYWINWSTDEFHLNAPYRGKGSGPQLQMRYDQAIIKTGAAVESADEARRYMRRHGLGVDCSGFAYHLLQAYLSSKRLGPLSRHLFFTPHEIQEAMKRHPERAKLALMQDVERITLEEVAHAWQRNPIAWAGVSRLMMSDATIIIERASDVCPGDIIKLTGQGGDDHVAVVIATTERSITYAQSIYRAGTLGGVEVQVIPVTDPHRGLEAQDWIDRGLYRFQTGDRVRRLNVLNLA